MEYQLATYTPLNKTARKKKIKRKPAAELEPIPVHYLLLIFICTLCSVWFLDIWRFGYSFERAEFCLCGVQLSEYELDREQRVKRNHIMMGKLVRATFFLSFKSFGFADCGVLFREFQSWFSSSTQSNPRLNQTDAERMKQQRLTTRIGGGTTISALIISWILNIRCEFRFAGYICSIRSLCSVSCFECSERAF